MVVCEENAIAQFAANPMTQDTILISIPDTLAAFPGDTTVVPVYLDLNGSAVAALGAAIKATNNLLSYIDSIPGPIIPGPFFGINAVTPDSLRLAFFDLGSGAITQSGLLVSLRFVVDPNASEGDTSIFKFSDLSATDPNLTNLFVASSSGKLIIVQNDAPVIMPISDQIMNEGDTLEIGVSASDPDGDSLSFTLINLPTFATFFPIGIDSGMILVTPGFFNSGFYENIEVIASDGILSDTTMFSLTVNDVNRRPILCPISSQITMNEGDTVCITLCATDPDNDLVTLSVNNLPSFGTFADSILCFMPQYEDSGIYADIEIIALDNGSPPLSDTTYLTLIVLDSNRTPIALNDTSTTLEDSSVTIFVLNNDTDPDNDSLRIVDILQPNNGVVNIDVGDTTITYSPNENFFGSDTFAYEISDNHGGIAWASVIVSVISVNDPPVISGLPDSVVFSADSFATLPIWDYVNDVETPDSLLTYLFTTTNDSLVYNFDSLTGTLTLTAITEFNGTVYLDMTIIDPDSAMANAILRVVVEPVLTIKVINESVPKKYILMQNYPNPFNAETTIRFGLPKAEHVVVDLYNSLGQRVLVLLDRKIPAGYHTTIFNASGLPTGAYFYRIKAGKFIDVKKMLLLR